MGVHGLWQLLQPTGKPVTLESLEGKVLAVDISIWLHHLVKGMRDGYGNPIPNAHLLGLFKRICKLLFYRIKPIFVFDGGVPELKKQTMASRRQRKEEANLVSSKAAKKLLGLMLKRHAVSTVLGTGPSQPDKQDGKHLASQCVQSLTKQTNPDPFQLRPLSEAERPLEINEENDLWEDRMAIRNEVFVGVDDLEDIDIESDDFKSLPPEIQHEILTDLKEARKWTCYLKAENLPVKSDEFSSYQLQKLMKQNHLTRHINRVRDQMTRQESGDVAASLTSAQHAAGEIETNRIVSEDSSHYILIKGLRSMENDDEQTKVEDPERAVQEIFEQTKKESKLRQEAKTKLLSAERPDGATKESESNFSTGLEATSKGQVEKATKERKDQDSEASYVSVEKKLDADQKDDQISDKVPEFAYRQLPPSKEVNLSDDDDDDDSDDNDDELLLGVNNVKSSGRVSLEKERFIDSDTSCKLTERQPTPPLTVSAEETCNENAELGKRHAGTSDNDDDRNKLPRIEASTSGNSHLNEETGELSEEEEDFIEISVDPDNAKPDEELFPASIFTQSQENSERQGAASQTFGEHSTESNQPPQTDEASELNTTHDDDDLLNMPDGNEFGSMSHTELLELQHVLEEQSSELRSVKQQQERTAASITDQMYAESQELLDLFGLPYIISPLEAEAQCAFLDLTNQTQGTITDDSDIWLFGGKRVYKNFFNQSKHVEFYQIQDIQSQMLLDRVKMINLALLCGSDYTDGIQGVGPVTAMEILGEFPGSGLTPLLEFKKWWNSAQKEVKVKQETKVKSKLRQLHVNDGFPNEVVAEAYFSPTVDESDESFSWGMPNLDLLREYSNKKFGWTQKKADDMLLPVMKQLTERQHQRHITDYIINEPHESRKPKSRRVQRILNRMRTDGMAHVEESQPDWVTASANHIKSSGTAPRTAAGQKRQTSDSSNAGGGWMQAPGVPCGRDEPDPEPSSALSGSRSGTHSGKDDIQNRPSRGEANKVISKDYGIDVGQCQDEGLVIGQGQSDSHSVKECAVKSSKKKAVAKTSGRNKGRTATRKQKKSAAGQRKNPIASCRIMTEVKLSESDTDSD